MFGVGPATRIYLAAGATDLRKNFEGLYGLVRDRLSCDPLSGHILRAATVSLFIEGGNLTQLARLDRIVQRPYIHKLSQIVLYS